MEANNHELKKLELNGIYDYNVYYYGLSKVILYYNNQTFDLEKALKENVISMNEIIEESEKSATENKIKSSKYLDGVQHFIDMKILQYLNVIQMQ